MRRIVNSLVQATVRERAQELKFRRFFVAISDYVKMRAQHYCNERCTPVYKLQLRKVDEVNCIL